MTPQQFERVKNLFERAVALPVSKRSAFLDHESSDDLEVRLEVERLLEQETAAFRSAGIRGVVADALRGADPSAGVPTLDAVDLTTDPSAAAARAGSLEGATVSHYDVRERLGAGGMGEVYRAHDRALDRPAALKVLQPGFSRSIRSRLLREAWASARLQHPCIATFYEAGEADGVDFIAMEYVAGRTLSDHLAEGGLETARALETVTSVLEALVHAHFFGILHRDIKPANLMLTEDGRVKVLDFGLAKAVIGEAPEVRDPAEPEKPSAERSPQANPDEHLEETVAYAAPPTDERLHFESVHDLTQAGVVLGTLGYMPPEQLHGRRVDERADLFSTGAVLYEMLAGRPAFPGSTARERITAILEREPEPLPSGRIPEGLRELVMRSLAKDPSERFASAREFVAAIRQVEGHWGHTGRPMTLAALDLEYLADDESMLWMAGALPDALVSSLNKIDGVIALPRQKVKAVAAAAAAAGQTPSDVDVGVSLACDLVLSGTLGETDHGMAARVRLTEVATGQSLLDELVTGGRNEMLAAPPRFAMAAAAALDLTAPASAETSTDFETYESYSRGRQLALSAEHARMEEGRELLEKTVAISPDFAPALAQLTFMYAAKYNYTADRTAVERALEYGRRAVAADPGLAEAHLYLGYAQGGWRGDLEGFDRLSRAMELNPTDFMAPYFLSSGLAFIRKVEELKAVLGSGESRDPTELHARGRARGRELAQRALRLNPMFAWGWLSLGWLHIEDANFTEARWCLEKAVEIEPRAVPPVSGTAGYVAECLRREGLLDDARRRFHEGLTATERKDHIYRDTFRGLFLCGLGKTALTQDDTEAARAAFTQCVLHIRGRAGTRCGGHALVQSLAGLTRAGEGDGPFEEAHELFDKRTGYDFTPIWGLFDDGDLLELARAAHVLGRHDQARTLLARSIDLGSTEAESERL
jgi:serine/threonine protein kinase/tetratricopeptide (TPR) repeat protein